MAKFCSNGHQMEDSWTDCPYCVRTGYQRSGLNGGLGETRLESPSADSSPAQLPVRKTVLMAALHQPPVVGWLVAMNGQHKGEDFRLREGQNLIGSARDVEVNLKDPAISAKHASIRYKDGVFSLTDLDSTNGTYLNEGTEGIAREVLKDNDLIWIGDISLKFKCL